MLLRTMSVEADEPGRRLVLVDRFPVVPKAAVAIVGTAIVALVGLPMIKSAIALARSGTRSGALVDLAVACVAPVLVLALLATVVRSRRCIGRFVVDRVAQRIEVTEMRIFGGGSRLPEVIPLVQVRGLNVRAMRQAFRGSPTASASAGLAVTVKVVFREDSGRKPRQLAFAVEGLDRIEEGVDLALRIASAAGFEDQRLVRNDSQGTEMEFGSAPGFAPLAEAAGKADYAQDKVQDAAQTLAAHDQTPGFDPASFAGDHVVDVWQPGVEVRFRRPMTFAAISCAPGVLTFLVGPWILVSAFRGSASTFVDGLVTGGFFLLVGLIVGTFASVIVWSSVARTVTFDWADRRLRLKTLFVEQSWDFSSLACLELQRVRIRKYDDYKSELYAQITVPARSPKRIELLSTKLYNADPGAPYGIGVSLLTDLAKATGVKQVITDDDRRS